MHQNEETDPPANPDRGHPITILSQIYLEIGLPLHAAVQAAIADYNSIFDEAVLRAA